MFRGEKSIIYKENQVYEKNKVIINHRKTKCIRKENLPHNLSVETIII